MIQRSVFCVSVVISLLASATPSMAASQDQAQHMFSRLVGVPLQLTDPRLKQMADLIDAGKPLEAAAIATADDNFYNVTVRQWANSMNDKGATRHVEFNDFVATLIGATRDDMDAREILSGDFKYIGKDIGQPRANDNNHYKSLDDNDANLAQVLVKQSPQWPNTKIQAAGVFTTRAWAQAHYIAGTNRRALDYAFKSFLCSSVKEMSDTSRPFDRIRRDVPRKPNESAATFQNTCRGCHAGMDSMSGAFAKFDFVNEQINYSDGIQPKYNQNSRNYPNGYVTDDDSWLNYWTETAAAKAMGWRGDGAGTGIKSWGAYIANSKAFSGCMTRRVFAEVCRRNPLTSEQMKLDKLSSEFEGDTYNLKKLWQRVAVESGCVAMN